MFQKRVNVMGMKFTASRKLVGNVNRLTEYREAGWSAEESRDAMASHGLKLVVRHGDFPLHENQAELSRMAVSKSAVRADIQAREAAVAVVAA